MTDPHHSLPWHHRVIVRYGPLGLIALGLALLVVSVLTHRSDAVEVGYLTLGTVVVLAGVLIPRFRGPVEVGTTGVKGSLADISVLDPHDYAIFEPGMPAPLAIGAGALEPDATRPESAGPETWQSKWADATPEALLNVREPGATGGTASGVTIQQLMDLARDQGWTIQRSPTSRHTRLVAPDDSSQILIPASPSWYATQELLRVALANGLSLRKAETGSVNQDDAS